MRAVRMNEECVDTERANEIQIVRKRKRDARWGKNAGVSVGLPVSKGRGKERGSVWLVMKDGVFNCE